MQTMTLTVHHTNKVSNRRYLTDPQEIKACRRRIAKRILKMFGQSARKFPGKALTFINRCIAQITFTSAVCAAWLGILGVAVWALTFILENCTVNW